MGQSGILGAVRRSSPRPPPRPPATADMALIQEAWDTIHENYVDAKNLDDQELAYGAIRGMTEAVGDEGHTSFLTADEAKAADQSLSGHVRRHRRPDQHRDRGRRAPSSARSSPTRRPRSRDLKRGDRIISVDGWKTEGHTVEEVVSRVRGPEGEPVTLTIGRDGTARLRRHDHPPPVRPAARDLVDGPGPRRRDDPAGAVRDGRDEGGRGRDQRTPRRPAQRRSSSTCAATPAAT